MQAGGQTVTKKTNQTLQALPGLRKVVAWAIVVPPPVKKKHGAKTFAPVPSLQIISNVCRICTHRQCRVVHNIRQASCIGSLVKALYVRFHRHASGQASRPSRYTYPRFTSVVATNIDDKAISPGIQI